ncbi:hypothetical protein HAX54_023857 [Datura stramonium]|uniref:Uncharacterized protein n=1 Tax=Datura stramonium TaxID=4076 RepID=A0ABS8RKG1_DATST|nr:hypothetical protein [Datura stramonium]
MRWFHEALGMLCHDYANKHEWVHRFVKGLTLPLYMEAKATSGIRYTFFQVVNHGAGWPRGCVARSMEMSKGPTIRVVSVVLGPRSSCQPFRISAPVLARELGHFAREYFEFRRKSVRVNWFGPYGFGATS